MPRQLISEQGRRKRMKPARRNRRTQDVICRDDEEYDMNHSRRGRALIFNHKHFQVKSPRTGSERDVAALTKTFQNLGFDVQNYADLKLRDLFDTLKDVAKENHSDRDCLVVTVMTHGNTRNLYCADGLYPTEKLWECFTADQCPTLAGKPKLFFIQACRGKKADIGVKMRRGRRIDTESRSWYTLPTCADILIAQSSAEGYTSWRSTREGSWFIQTLCEELNRYGGRRDLLTILTSVCRRVATEYDSMLIGDTDLHPRKQVPAFTSMLTRRLYFR